MKKEKSKLRLPVIIGLICALVAAAYVVFVFRAGQPKPPLSGPKAAKPIRIGSFSIAIDYSPLIVARSKGWLEAELATHNAKLEFTTFQTLPSINEAFAANQLDVVFEAEVPAIVGRAAGIDIRITGLGATLTEGILARSESSIKKVTDLSGHSVAVLSGTAMHFGLVNLLRSSGIDPGAVKIINMVPPDAAAAFSAGQVDAWAVWPPWPEQQVINKTGRFLSDAEAQVQSVIVMRQGFIAEGAAAKGIARVIDRAKVWLQDNEAEGITLIAQELKLPEEVVRLAWPKHNWKARLTPDVVRDIEAKATFLLEQKMIQHPVSPSALVTPLN